MARPALFHSFSARLIAGIVVLVLLTTLSAGVPAYWLTRMELDRQTWARIFGAERATRSLLAAEQERIETLLTLLTERPTLRRLLREETPHELPDYLSAFGRQSALDLLLLCQEEDAVIPESEVIPPCPPFLSTGFVRYASRPAMVAAMPVRREQPAQGMVTAVAGIWLDETFLRQLATSTDVEQSILAEDGARLASSLSLQGEPTFADVGTTAGEHTIQTLRSGDRHFYAERLPLATADGRTTLFLEIALPVDDLIITERRSWGILALSTSLVSLVGILLSIWSVRRLTTPLQKLTHTAEAISGGDLSAPIPPPSGPSEVQTLATALRRSQASMLAALDDLAQTRDWLDSLVQSIVEGVVTFDEAGSVTFINEKAAALAVRSSEEAVGCHVDDLLPAVDEAGNRLSLQSLSLQSRHRITLVHNGGEPAQPLRRPGQRAVRRLARGIAAPARPLAVLDVTAARLRSPAGKETQTALILRDITEEEALRHLRAYFLANITHEFRTPLSTLNAAMELLTQADDLGAAEMRQLLKPIHLSLVSLQTLIDNLLESSSIEAGRFALRKQAIDLDEVIGAAIRVVQPLLERRTQTLALSEPVFLPPLVGDATRLALVLVNLLSNASKYSPPNTVIELVVAQEQGRLRLAVADQGPGIPAAERQTLFRRFMRLEANDAEQYGIGLGLHVVKTTVEAHGGRVGVDERPQGGSVFWFELPLDDGPGR
jgi:signal transduction histidine kinase/HAMP domain-containing protein